MRIRRADTIVWTAVSTLAVEAVTLCLRFRSGLTAAAFNQTAPLLLQIHHMFWSIPLLAVAVAVRQKARLSSALVGVACGMVLSDLLHHFVVLPLTVGNTGWHWP